MDTLANSLLVVLIVCVVRRAGDEVTLEVSEGVHTDSVVSLTLAGLAFIDVCKVEISSQRGRNETFQFRCKG